MMGDGRGGEDQKMRTQDLAVARNAGLSCLSQKKKAKNDSSKFCGNRAKDPSISIALDRRSTQEENLRRTYER